MVHKPPIFAGIPQPMTFVMIATNVNTSRKTRISGVTACKSAMIPSETKKIAAKMTHHVNGEERRVIMIILKRIIGS